MSQTAAQEQSPGPQPGTSTARPPGPHRGTGGRHIVVVGAGIVGVCAALQLLRDGQRVTLVDRGPPGEGTSFGNAAVIEPHGIRPVATPGVLWKVPGYLMDPLGPLAIRWRYLPRLLPWLARFAWNSRPAKVERSTQALNALLHPVLESYRDLVAWAGAEDMIREQGWLAIAETEATWKGYREEVEVHRRFGVPLSILGPEQVRQQEPSLATPVVGGVYYPKVAHVVNNFRFVQVLAEAAVRLGATLESDSVTGFERADGRVTEVIGAARRYACDGVVLACGAWSKVLAAQLGSRPPLDTERGYHLTIPDPGIALRQPLLSLERGFVATPLEIGMRVAGTDELGGLDLPPNWKRAEVIHTHVKRWFPTLNSAGTSRWMGFRPSLPDSVPIISASPRVSNAWFAFGHGHLGLTMGSRTGELVAALVAGRDPGIDMAPYRVDRW